MKGSMRASYDGSARETEGESEGEKGEREEGDKGEKVCTLRVRPSVFVNSARSLTAVLYMRKKEREREGKKK